MVTLEFIVGAAFVIGIICNLIVFKYSPIVQERKLKKAVNDEWHKLTGKKKDD